MTMTNYTNPHETAAVAEMARALTDDLRWNDTATHYSDDAAELDDPETQAPAGAWRYRATVQPDNDTSVNDFDCYGKIEHGKVNRYTGHEERPAGFTGAARKIKVGRGDFVWWEPYREGHKVYDSPDEVRIITDLLQQGFHGVTLVIEERTRWTADDATGARLTRWDWREVGSASLWGIDSTDEVSYRREVIADLIQEAVSEGSGSSVAGYSARKEASCTSQ